MTTKSLLPRHTAVLIGLFTTTALAAVYNGGAATDILFALLAALTATAILIGPDAWSQLIYSTTSLRHLHLQKLAFPTAAGIYVLGLIFATWISQTPGLSLELGLRMALLPILYAVTRAALNSGIEWRAIWTCMRWVGLALSALALSERLLTGDRVYATFSDPNALAGVFNIFIITELFATFKQSVEGRLNSANILVLAIFSLGEGTTGSLSGLVSLAIILLCSTIIIIAKIPATRQKIKPWLVAVFVLILAIVGSRGGSDTPDSKLKTLSTHSSFTVRKELTEAAINMYRDHAWYGSGLGTFVMYYPRYRGPLDTGSAGILVHNDYAQYLQEGGPLSLGSLLLIGALVLWTLLKSLRTDAYEVLGSQLEVIGCCLAILSILLQASMNFMLYIALTALLFGVVLARVEERNEEEIAPVSSSGEKSLVFATVSVAIALLLAGVMGARGLFILLTVEDRCGAHACSVLRTDLTFMSKLTAYLSGTQPTWLPARVYIISDLSKGIAAAESDDRKSELRRKAAKELLGLIRDVPLLADSYSNLADLITEDGQLAELIKKIQPTLPFTSIGLYQQSLELVPQNISFRLKLATALSDAHRDQEAYQILVDGLRYWRMEEWGDARRMELLEKMIPLEVSLHHCTEAREAATSLNMFLEGAADAKATGNTKLLPAGTTPQLIQEGREAVLIVTGNCI